MKLNRIHFIQISLYTPPSPDSLRDRRPADGGVPGPRRSLHGRAEEEMVIRQPASPFPAPSQSIYPRAQPPGVGPAPAPPPLPPSSLLKTVIYHRPSCEPEQGPKTVATVVRFSPVSPPSPPRLTRAPLVYMLDVVKCSETRHRAVYNLTSYARQGVLFMDLMGLRNTVCCDFHGSG